MISSLRFLAAIALCSPNPGAAPAEAPPAAAVWQRQGSQKSHQAYGLYLNGHKAGWMVSDMDSTPEAATLSTEVHARVGGMGSAQDIALTEVRRYGPGPRGPLLEVRFAQTATTGSVTVSARRVADGLQVEVDAGGSTHSERLDCHETWADAVAAERLAVAGKPGHKVEISRFDPSVQKVLAMVYVVQRAERRQIAGVAVETVLLRADCAELGVKEDSWFDRAGKLLESRMGGFFETRLEPEDLARQMDGVQDVLVGAAVRAPTPIVAQERVQTLRLSVAGFGDALPPAAERQQVCRVGDHVELTLHQQVAPQVAPLLPPQLPPAERPTPLNVPPPAPATEAGTAGAPAAELKAALAATPFIQSDDPKLRAAAQRAVRGAADPWAASVRLVHFVHRHMHSEYVPAYSNALEAYTSARGDCTEHSVLFVALARAAQIPARVALGLVYWPPGQGFGWHAWAEVHVAGQWWAVDPTWDQPLADATHIKLAEGSPAEQARIAMLLGSLRIVDMATAP